VKPSGETITVAGTDVVVDDAATGQIHILMTASFDETGEYMLQAKATFASSTKFGPIMGFVVEDVIVAVP